MLLEFLHKLRLLFTHLLRELGLSLIEFVVQGFLHVGTLFAECELSLRFLFIELFCNFALKDFAEDSGEFSDSLVKKREQLVGLEVQVNLKVCYRFVTQSKTQKNCWLGEGQLAD